MMNDAPDSRLETAYFLVLTHSWEGPPSYYMKRIDIHDFEVSISAWVSHVRPLKQCDTSSQINLWSCLT